MIDGGAAITNRGTLSGSLVSIEAGELQNGLGAPGGIDGSGFGNYSGTTPGGISGNAAGQLGIVNFVLDDVSVPPLDLGAFEARNLHSVNAADFGNLVRVTGSTEAARLLGLARIDGAALTFYADPLSRKPRLSPRRPASRLVRIWSSILPSPWKSNGSSFTATRRNSRRALALNTAWP